MCIRDSLNSGARACGPAPHDDGHQAWGSSLKYCCSWAYSAACCRAMALGCMKKVSVATAKNSSGAEAP